MSREVLLVDAFASGPYTGNVAGVVPDAAGLTDPQMQAIARELSAPETAFILPAARADAAIALRWFTPTSEVEFCGHATLAAIHALLESGRFARSMNEPGMILPIETRARGLVTVRTELRPGQSDLIWFDSPDVTLRPANVSFAKIGSLLGLDPSLIDMELPAVLTIDGDLILPVQDAPTLLSLQPRMNELADFCRERRMRGVAVTTRRPLSRAVVAHSRFFAPAFGIPEDPVTGSFHGPLGAYLVKHGVAPIVDGRAAFGCAQSQAGGRAGIVRVVVTLEGETPRVRVGGACVTTTRGNLVVLPEARSE